jgi:hypothetical protein
MIIQPLPVELKAPSELEVRVMTSEEIAQQEHLFIERGVSLPDPGTSTFMGAFKGGKCVGFLVLQIKLHAEPLYIEEGHSQILTPLVRQAEKYILQRCGPTWVYLFSPAGRTAQLAQSMGMQLEPWVVLSKLVMPEEPARPIMFELNDLPTDEAVQ